MGMLQRLGLDYVDLVLLHAAWPDRGKKFSDLDCKAPRKCREDTWRALEQSKFRGLIRSLGVSNFGPKHIMQLLSLNASRVALNQIEYHPMALPLVRQTVSWCHQKGIAVTAAAPFGGRIFSK